MSNTGSLTKFYGNFFFRCGKFAVSPYLMTLTAFSESSPPKNDELLLGAIACVALSTIVPILPTITSITFAIASFAASIAVSSMFISYPIALVLDAMNPTFDDGLIFN